MAKLSLVDCLTYYSLLLNRGIRFEEFKNQFISTEDELKFQSYVENARKFQKLGVFIEESEEIKRLRTIIGTLNGLENYLKDNSEIIDYYKDKYEDNIPFPGFLLKLYSEPFEINSKFNGGLLLGSSAYEKISEFIQKWDDEDSYYGLAFSDLYHSAGLVSEGSKKGLVKISATLKEIKLGLSTIVALPLATKKENMKRNFTDEWGYDNMLNGKKFDNVPFNDIKILDLTGDDKIGLNVEHNWNFRFTENDLFLLVGYEL